MEGRPGQPALDPQLLISLSNARPDRSNARANCSGTGVHRAFIQSIISKLLQTRSFRRSGPVTVEGNEQYQDLCQQLVQRPEFAGSGYSWGDSVIVKCASGSVEPGAQPTWRGAGTRLAW